MIANLALDGLEAKLREKYPKASNASRKAKANLVRFADDFIITGSSKELLEKEIKPLVEQFMKERGLELSVFVNDIGGQFSNQNRGNGSQFVSEG